MVLSIPFSLWINLCTSCTLYYLTSVYLRRIDALFIFFYIILYTHHKIRLSSFWHHCRGKLVFYANINTKCFFNTSNILFMYIFVWLLIFLYFLFSFCINFQVKITMEPINELTNALAHLEQQLRMWQLANEHQKRVTTQVRSQVWQPYASMDYAQYKGAPYLSNHNFGWSYHPNTSWNTSYTTLQSPQVQRSSLEEAMDELRRAQAESTMVQPEFSRSMAEMDLSS